MLYGSVGPCMCRYRSRWMADGLRSGGGDDEDPADWICVFLRIRSRSSIINEYFADHKAYSVTPSVSQTTDGVIKLLIIHSMIVPFVCLFTFRQIIDHTMSSYISLTNGLCILIRSACTIACSKAAWQIGSHGAIHRNVILFRSYIRK